jgi:hypothetical protein
MTEKRYWIALNQDVCAFSELPFHKPLVTPTPEQLLGFPTAEEAYEAQQLCLHAPIPEVEHFLFELRHDVWKGRVWVIQPKHPQPPTTEVTTWTETSKVHSAVAAKTLN